MWIISLLLPSCPRNSDRATGVLPPDPSQCFNHFSGQITMDKDENPLILLLRSGKEQERVMCLMHACVLKLTPFVPREKLLLPWERRRQYSNVPVLAKSPSGASCFCKDPDSLGKVGRDFKRRCHLVVPVRISSLQLKRPVTKESSCSHLSHLRLNGRKNHGMFIL